MTERVLITGGSGLIGSRLAESLRASGVAVRILSRSAGARAPASERDPARAREQTAGDPPGAARGIERMRWDGVQLPDGALDGCSALVHLAGEPIFGGPLTRERRRRIASSRIDSTRAIAAALLAAHRAGAAHRTGAAHRAGAAHSAGAANPAGAAHGADWPAVFLCASAVGFYGSRGDELLTEGARAGSGFLAELCEQWEAAAATAADALRVVSLRLGIVLSRAGGALPLLALPFRFGLGGRFGDGAQWVPWIQLDDAVGALRFALRDDALRGALNVVAPNPVRNAVLSRAIARALHRPALLPVPAVALRCALGELSGELLGSRRCIPERLLAAGFAFEHREIESALAAELARRG